MAENKTWMPMTAGILDIVAGGFGLVIAFMSIFMGGIMRLAPNAPASPLSSLIVIGLGLLLAVLGILAIVGGIFALQRKIWGLALAGSIAAFIDSCFSFIFVFPLLVGIAAIVFTVLSKNEFE
jgi:hypothetical protein